MRDAILMAAAAALATALLTGCDRAGDAGALEVANSWYSAPRPSTVGASPLTPLWVARP